MSSSSTVLWCINLPKYCIVLMSSSSAALYCLDVFVFRSTVMRVNKDGTDKTNVGPPSFRQLSDIRVHEYGTDLPGECMSTALISLVSAWVRHWSAWWVLEYGADPSGECMSTALICLVSAWVLHWPTWWVHAYRTDLPGEYRSTALICLVSAWVQHWSAWWVHEYDTDSSGEYVSRPTPPCCLMSARVRH